MALPLTLLCHIFILPSSVCLCESLLHLSFRRLRTGCDCRQAALLSCLVFGRDAKYFMSQGSYFVNIFVACVGPSSTCQLVMSASTTSSYSVGQCSR